MTSTKDIEHAEIIVNDYGKLLSATEPSIYGIALSRLPYDKEVIKSAIQTLLLNIDDHQSDIFQSLTQAYVFLAQFIPDEELAIAEYGRAILEASNMEITNSDIKGTEDDLELANQAIQTINSIKMDMENLMSELRLVIQ